MSTSRKFTPAARTASRTSPASQRPIAVAVQRPGGERCAGALGREAPGGRRQRIGRCAGEPRHEDLVAADGHLRLARRERGHDRRGRAGVDVDPDEAAGVLGLRAAQQPADRRGLGIGRLAVARRDAAAREDGEARVAQPVVAEPALQQGERAGDVGWRGEDRRAPRRPALRQGAEVAVALRARARRRRRRSPGAAASRSSTPAVAAVQRTRYSASVAGRRGRRPSTRPRHERVDRQHRLAALVARGHAQRRRPARRRSARAARPRRGGARARRSS